MYKIYINEKRLTLCNSKKLDKFRGLDNVLIARYNGHQRSLYNYIDMLEKGCDLDQIILHADPKKQLVIDFKSIYNEVKAAGGLVLNEQNQILFIFRKGLWDLPKGKLDAGETMMEGAIREVEEETGANSLEIIRKLAKTRHSFSNKSPKRQIKKTQWYLMKTHTQKLIPQAEESITKAEWMSLDAFYSEEREVYKSIEDILSKYKNSLKIEPVQ